jgi:hypothetical protein
MELDLVITKLSNEHREAILDNRVAFEALLKRMYQTISMERACSAPNHQQNIEQWGGMQAISATLQAIEGIAKKKIEENTVVEIEE